MLYCCINRCIITWMLHQIFKYSNKVIVAASKIRIPSYSPFTILFPPTGWTNFLINKVHVSNLNFNKFFPVNISTYIFYPLFSFFTIFKRDELLDLLAWQHPLKRGFKNREEGHIGLFITLFLKVLY